MTSPSSSNAARRRISRKLFEDDDSELPPLDPTAMPGARTAAQLLSMGVGLRCTAHALLILSAIWGLHPKSYREERWEVVVIWGGACTLGPLIAAASSLWVLRRGKSIESRIARGIIKVSTAVLIAIFLPLMTLGIGLRANNLLPLFVSLLLLIAMAIVGLLRLRFGRQPVGWTYERLHHRLIIGSVAVPIVGVPLWSLVNILLVGLQAWMIAGTQPYCIQVPNRTSLYQPARSWSEFSGLRMHTPWEEAAGSPTGYSGQWSFHAVLVVAGPERKEFYNWSYASWGFVPISERVKSTTHVRAKCMPKPNFLYTLDLF